MPAFVDIHAHLLPGIDDGPPDLERALLMARAAAGSGTSVLAATPHLRSDYPRVVISEIEERRAAVQRAIEAAGIELTVVAGAEASLVWAVEASDEELRLASYGQAGRDLLIETPSDASMVEQLLYQLRLRGFRITLAHPERSEVFRSDPMRLKRLREQGVLLQVNAAALLARRGSQTRGFAEFLCRDGLAQALASDGHGGGAWRPVNALLPGAEALERLVGPERAQWMVSDAPGAIVAGEAVGDGPPVITRRRLFGRH